MHPLGVLRSLAIACAALCLSPVAHGAAPAQQPPAPAATVHTAELPGGAEGIRRAIGDRVPTPPATLVVEMTRRVHGGTSFVARDDPTLARLRVWLRACEQAPSCGVAGLGPDRVPLPGPPAFWRDTVFDGRVPDGQIVPAILGRRDASFLYTALLSMREDVRAWLIARPALVKQILAAGPGALVVAAPSLRLDGGAWQLPGGAAAVPVWTALSGGVRPDEPEAWLAALVRRDDGFLAYALEVMDALPVAMRDAGFALDAPDEARRTAAGLELLQGLRAATPGWQLRDRPFWRPSYDPGFLLSQLTVGADGALAVPGGRAFWDLLAAGGDLTPADAAAQAAWRDAPFTPAVLAKWTWTGDAATHAERYEQVLFAARRLASVDAAHAADAATVLRGSAQFPQLLRILDRLDAADVARLAAVVRRARALRDAAGDWRGRAAVVRWQATLVALDHMARLGALDRGERDRALDALAAPDAASAPRGAHVRALIAALGIEPIAGDVQARPAERALVARLTRSSLGGGRRVAWEGETYRLDIGEAERDRLARVRGRDALPQLDAALAAFALAEADAAPPDAQKRIEAIARAARLDRTPLEDGDFAREARAAASRARQSAGRGDRRDWAAVRAALDDLGDALAADGFGEIAYALNMGWADDLPLTALEAFRRHRFQTASPTGARDASWLAPDPSASRSEAWHVAGSLLGLDDALAAVALRRPSLKPLTAAPSLNTGDRRWLVSTVAAFDRRLFTDEAQAALVARVTRGQERLRAVHDAAAARAAAEAAGTSPLRQTLAAWIAEADPPALASVFSTTEIARLGSDGAPLPALFEGWGNVQPPVTGRLAPGPLPSQPWEHYAGKSARLVSAALPDLQLALAVRLAALDLPAVLVPDLMSSATFELVNLAEPRHADDFDALTAHVRAIDAEAMERYLGALTTAGPLRRDGSSGSGRTTRSTARLPGGPTLTIREPAEGTPALGATTIAVELAPAPAGVTVVMTVDGRELCRLERGPWSCTWDADGEMQEHHLRVAATLPDGRRLVASRRTRGLDINERVEVSAVQVPVIVTDGRGRFVKGLKPQAFTLLENGKRQRIDTVIDESLPLELVAAVDISASMEGSMPDVRSAVKGLLGRLRPADTTTLLGFNESVFVLTERENDASLRELAVDSLVPWGGTAFYDATVRSLDLVSQKAGRRGVVVFSDGDDRHSVGRRDASLRRIEEGQVAVYTVGFGTGTSAQFRTTLTAFAEASGGRAYFPRRVEDLDAAFGSIVEELSHQYILSYVSTAPADGSWRTLQIKACEGCHVRAREGYRAPEH